MDESERVPSKEEMERLGQMSSADPMHGTRLEVGGNTQSGYAAHPRAPERLRPERRQDMYGQDELYPGR